MTKVIGEAKFFRIISVKTANLEIPKLHKKQIAKIQKSLSQQVPHLAVTKTSVNIFLGEHRIHKHH